MKDVQRAQMEKQERSRGGSLVTLHLEAMVYAEKEQYPQHLMSLKHFTTPAVPACISIWQNCFSFGYCEGMIN